MLCRSDLESVSQCVARAVTLSSWRLLDIDQNVVLLVSVPLWSKDEACDGAFSQVGAAD